MTLGRNYGTLLAAFVQDRASCRQMMRMSLLIAAIEILLLSMHGTPRGDSSRLVWVCLPWVVLQMWCGAFLKSAIRQNRPEYACLAPHLRTRLIRLVAVLYGADAVLLAVMTWLAFGHAGYGLMFAGAATVCGIFMNRYSALGWAFAVVIPLGSQFMGDFARLLGYFNEAALTIAGMVPLLLLGARGLQLTLPRGGDSHWRWQNQFCRRADALDGKPAQATAVQASARYRQLFRRLYAATLRRDSRPGVAASRAMMHVIGRSADPSRVIAFSLVSTLLALLIGIPLGDDGRAGMLTATCLVQLGAVLMYVIGVADDAVLHGAEQQLYLLTPSAPPAARINRLLTATVLRRALAVWLVSLACAVCLDSVRSGHLTLRGGSFAMAMLVLWTVPPLLRNYAVAPGRRLAMTWNVTTVLVVLLSLGVLALLQAAPNFPWYKVGCLTGIGAMIYLGLRWRALMALPPVLPAGRLAV